MLVALADQLTRQVGPNFGDVCARAGCAAYHHRSHGLAGMGLSRKALSA